MTVGVSAVPVAELLPWRERFREEMRCQIVHDSLHARAGWTESFLLTVGPVIAGYGAAAVAGPWRGTKTVFEFYLMPEFRPRAEEFFARFVAVAGVTAYEVQTNDELLTRVVRPWSGAAEVERLVFHDHITTMLAAQGARLRRATPADATRIFPHQHEPVGDWLLEVEDRIAATGGILFHYNRPYGDLYMETAAPFRRRGFGSYLVQELKRICREGGSIPCARCSPANIASRKTLLKAGFAPCAEILVGRLVPTGE